MRPHGRAVVNAARPSAFAVCDQCGFLYNLQDLVWNSDWAGPKLQNQRILVCFDCNDKPQPNGQKTFILPPDPLSVINARPEYYIPDDNPLSAVGVSANFFSPTYGSRIGNMTDGGGINSAMDGNSYKVGVLSAIRQTPHSSYDNYVGMDWAGQAQALSAPSSLLPPVITHTVTSYTISAPLDQAFGSTAYLVQGSPVAADYGSWTTISSGSIAGTIGEVITGTAAGGRYQFHRVAFYGGTTPIYVAQVQFSVSDGSSW